MQVGLSSRLAIFRWTALPSAAVMVTGAWQVCLREREEALRVPIERAWVCTVCGQAVVRPGRSVAGPSRSGQRCRNLWCAAPGRSLEAVFAVGSYEGALRKAIVAYKYRWDLRWARPFGALLYRFITRHPTWFEEYAVICPMPQFMGPGGRRPWEHVGLVCAEVSRLADGEWPVERLLTKVCETDLMSSKDKLARRELARRSLRRAFVVTDPTAVEGRRILLVDDVCASGYTLLTVARALRRAGADEVAALVLARARWHPQGRSSR
jgi:predicted amidophosphoribosyltransferase